MEKATVLVRCKMCKRVLTNPISREIGIGSVCRIQLKTNEYQNAQLSLFNESSEYEWGVMGKIAPVIWIVDKSVGCRTVTQDIDKVISDILRLIAKTENPQPPRAFKIMYKDLQGIWDRVHLSSYNRFSHFSALTKTSKSEAYNEIISQK